MALQKISATEIEQAKKTLSKLPSKQHPSRSVADALEELKPLILETLDNKNYTREELLQILEKCGIKIKPYRLKELFGEKKLGSAPEIRIPHSPAVE